MRGAAGDGTAARGPQATRPHSQALAQQTGLTKSYLSKIERRRSTPSIAVALKVAKALDVDVGRLFSEEAAHEKITVERAASAEGERYRVLASSVLGKSMSPFVVRPTERPADDPIPSTRVRNSCSCTPGPSSSTTGIRRSPSGPATAPISTPRSATRSGPSAPNPPRSSS